MDFTGCALPSQQRSRGGSPCAPETASSGHRAWNTTPADRMDVSPAGLKPGPLCATASGADRTETARSCNWRDRFHAVPPLGYGWRGFRGGLGRGGAQASKADAVESLENPAVCGQQGWGDKSPGAVRLPESVSQQAHSKRFASSAASRVAGAAHGVQQPKALRESA